MRYSDDYRDCIGIIVGIHYLIPYQAQASYLNFCSSNSI